jgi:hypothetical protein
MADPVSIMAVTSMGLSAAGAGVSFLGAKEAAGAQENMYAYKAAVAQQNQYIAAQNAQYEIQRGGILAQELGLKGAQQMGHIVAEQAASGIDVNTGTAPRVRTAQLTGIQTGEATTRSDAARRAYGFQIEGLSKTEEAQMDVMSGKAVAAALPYQEGSTLLSGASSVADKWMSYSKQGVPGFSSNPFSNIFGSTTPS